jgi:hypothetical protein
MPAAISWSRGCAPASIRADGHLHGVVGPCEGIRSHDYYASLIVIAGTDRLALAGTPRSQPKAVLN